MSGRHDYLLGQAALARGWLTRAQLDDALAAQARAAGDPPLETVLRQMSMLTAGQFDALAHDIAAMRVPTLTSGRDARTLDSDAPAAGPALHRSGTRSPTESGATAEQERAIPTQTGGPDLAPSAPAGRSHADLEGGHFGKYRLEQRIGQGGMGTVYRAFDTELHRVVAIKVLMGDEAEPERVLRFQREAETAGKLRHPNIVTIHGVGCESGRHYFVMEYVEGKDLSHLLRARAVTLDQAVALLVQVTGAIDHAHRHQVIHRDLKPQNIMVDAEGRALVTDFGLAREINAATRLTQTGKLLGTPMYMAPEQANAEAGRIDFQTDVYALGATLYEILTGRPPFDGDSPAEIVYAVLFKDPVPPTRLNRRVPQDLETICLKALEKEPPRRYATARALADDLRRFQAGEPIAAKRVGSFSRALRHVRRHRSAAALVLGATAVTALAIGFATVRIQESRERERQSAAQAEQNRQERARLEHQRQARETSAALLRAAEQQQPEAAVVSCTRAIAEAPDSVAALAARARYLTRLDRDREAIADYDRALVLDPDNLEMRYQRGELYAWGLGEPRLAAEDFRAILARDPDHVLALEGEATLLLFAGRNVDACQAFTKVIDKDPSRWSGYYYRGMAAGVGRDYPRALADLNAALEHRPDDPVKILVDRARFGNFALESQKALADAEQALSLRPRYAPAMIERALALHVLGRREEALQAGEEAIQLDPQNAEALARLAQIHRGTGDHARTIDTATRALRIKPDCIMALLVRAESYLSLDRVDEALADCEAVLHDSDLWADAHQIRGQIRHRRGEIEDAMRDFDRAIEISPYEPNTYMERAEVHRARGNEAAAQIDIQKHIDLLAARGMDTAGTHIVIARALASAGRIDEAIGHLTQALERNPKQVEALEHRVALLTQQGKLAQAGQDAARYIELDPGSFAAHRMAAVIHLMSDRPDAAVAEYEAALRLKPAGSGEVWNNLAHAYNMLGRTEDAVRALERGLALNPTEDSILYNLACLRTKSGRVPEGLDALAKAIEAGYDHFSHLMKDPDFDTVRDTEPFATRVAEACVERAARGVETGRSVQAYAPAQAKAEFERAERVLTFAASLADRIASRSLRARILWHRSTAYHYLRARDREIADLEQTARFDAAYESRWRHALGVRALDEGRAQEAVRELTAALHAEPDLAEAWCDRGKAQLELGDKDAARQDFHEGFQRRPELKNYYQAEWRRAGGE